MIGAVSVKVTAGHPEKPLAPVAVINGYDMTVEVVDAPKSGNGITITGISVAVTNADGGSISVSAERVGNVWTATIPGEHLETVGEVANGLAINAVGRSETGSVAAWGIGRGSLSILSADGVPSAGEAFQNVHYYDEAPTSPHKGDLAPISGVWKLYDGTQWVALGGSSTVAWDAVTGKPTTFPAIVDDTLSTRGTAADAEAVGEALSQRLSKTGGTLTGGIAIDGPNSETDSLKLGRASSSPGLYTINPYGINQGGETSNPTFPFYGSNRIARLDDTVEAAKSLTAAGQTALFASAVSSTTSTTLKDRDCATVAFSSGMTLTFTASTGLRQFEILITGCTASGSINFPDVTYRGASDALTLEAGDNHLVFAEYATGCFFVTRSVANTITIS